MRSLGGTRPMSGSSGRRNDESEKSLLDTANDDDEDEAVAVGISATRRITILVTLAAATIGGSLSSMQAFYTTAALDKNPGAGPGYHTAIGGVYSVFMVAGALALPMLTKDLPNIGSKNLIVLSHFITGSSLLVFASITTITDWRVFIFYSYCVRILLGVAFAMSTFPVMTYLIAMYPANLGFVNAFQITFLGIGHVSGVMFGGGFYDIGGFEAPFLFGGTVNVICSVILFVILIDIDTVHTGQNGSEDVKVHLEGIGVGDPIELRVAVASLSRFSLSIGYGLGSVIFTSMVALLGFPLAMTAIGLVYAGLAVLMLPLSWLHHVALKPTHKQTDTMNTDSADEDL
ncbi:MFS-type transporter SLC18B1-like [Sycon ciliatum]|uniref:MFS-type transporter SLC18B1-like n=1 Tax=Sycon ciliatum TaxID=27933 RepID=UPI0031F66720